MRYILKNALIITSEKAKTGSVAIDEDRIAGLWYEEEKDFPGAEVIDLSGLALMAGGIDAHVHFREPGLNHKGDILTESRAALLGGITSFMDMPNTNPPATTQERILEKSMLASGRSFCNFGFHIGATNSNNTYISGLCSKETRDFAGLKMFMGSSTGNMLVDKADAIEEFFNIKNVEILVHSEDEDLIKAGLAKAIEEYGDNSPFHLHSAIRSRKACIKSTAKALEKAIGAGTRLHILHISTKEEVEMIREAKRYNPRITAETSANYLWFCEDDYEGLGGLIKCNPSIKSYEDKKALRKAVLDGIIDTIGSDHAPHLLEEKNKPYLSCPSGIPSIQHSLSTMLTVASQENIPLTRIAEAMSENTAKIFGIKDRGILKEGAFADIVVFSPDKDFIAGEENGSLCSQGIDYKCGWSPYKGQRLKGAVKMVIVNGIIAVRDGRLIEKSPLGRPLSFSRNG